jgi:hypothetical protein
MAVDHRRGRLSFAPPGHKQARGADPAVREVLGDAVITPYPPGIPAGLAGGMNLPIPPTRS